MSTNKQDKAQPQRKTVEHLPLNRLNYLLMGGCLLLIVVGFALMSGSANEGPTFNDAIFESRRTVVGPLLAFAGFVLMGFAIITRRTNKK